MWEEVGTFPLEVDTTTEKAIIMMKPVPLEKAMFEILENACPATTHDGEGYMNYYIETHCIMWTVTAKKDNGQWIIKMCTGEAC